MIGQIALASFLAVLILWVEHWFPWQLMLRKPLPRVTAYILGVMALAIPLSVLYWQWDRFYVPPHFHLIALWSVVVSGGLAVMAAYAVDWLISRVTLAAELNEILSERDYGGQAKS